MNRYTSTAATPAARRALNRLAASALLAVSAAVALPSMAQPVAHGDGPALRTAHGGEHRAGKGAHHSELRHHARHEGHRAARGLDHRLDGLNVTDAQRTQIKKIWQDAHKDSKAQREARRALHEERRALLGAANLDERALEAVSQKQVALQEQAIRRLAQAELAAAKVLTPEQRTQLAHREKLQSEQRRERGERLHKHREQLRKAPAVPQPGAASR